MLLSQSLSAAAWDAACLPPSKKQRRIDRKKKMKRKKIKKAMKKRIKMKRNRFKRKMSDHEIFEILNFYYKLFI